MTVLAPAIDIARRLQPLRLEGVVAALKGMTLLVDELPAPVGTLVEVVDTHSHAGVRARRLGEVIGFSREHSIVMMLGQTLDIRPGDRVVGLQAAQVVPVGYPMLGRVVNGLGEGIDGRGRPRELVPRPLSPEPISAMQRRRIAQQLLTGLRAVDLMTPLGRGQRLGIFAGPGVGKSTMLGTIARRTNADINVIALIGERGREVKDFIEHSLGPEGLARSVVIVATGDESPLMRIHAAKLACAAAEFFRDEGRDVLLMMDSITRFAHAQRQIGLSAGEPPTSRGYTPSVFAQMALLLERAGSVETALHQQGSITGLYTILVEGDDMTEPVADAARGILDGHIILSRKLAQKAHFPAVDVLDSVSRVADDVTTPEHQAARRQVSRMLAIYKDVEDLVQIGAYARGSNRESDVAIDAHRGITELLRQGKDDNEAFEKSLETLKRIAAETIEASRAPVARKGGR
ncbi:MAG: FliI/YscN family ATPase [Phycisphaerales bacterium]